MVLINGIGAVGTAILGIVLFGESTEMLKLVSLGLICAGIIGLKVFHALTVLLSPNAAGTA